MDTEAIEEAKKKIISLSARQHEVMQLIMRRKNVFFTGAAGLLPLYVSCALIF
jgi:hypothetical protein